MLHLQRAVMVEIGRTQAIKWTIEGIVKGIFLCLVFYDVNVYVSYREYDSILTKRTILS